MTQGFVLLAGNGRQHRAGLGTERHNSSAGLGYTVEALPLAH